MSFRSGKLDREQDKFVETASGQTAVRVLVEGATFEIPGGLNVQLEHDGVNPDSVQIGDGVEILSINADGSINVKFVNTDTTATIFNKAVPLANTEVSQVLPVDTKRFIMRARGNSELQFSFTALESGSKFITIPRRANYEDPNFYSSATVYFQTSLSSETVEIIAYT